MPIYPSNSGLPIDPTALAAQPVAAAPTQAPAYTANIMQQLAAQGAAPGGVGNLAGVGAPPAAAAPPMAGVPAMAGGVPTQGGWGSWMQNLMSPWGQQMNPWQQGNPHWRQGRFQALPQQGGQMGQGNLSNLGNVPR